MLKRCALILTLSFAFLSCSPGEGECASAADCGALESVCEGCAELPEAFCIESECVAKPALEFTLVGDVSIDRDIDDQSASFVHSIFDARSASCAQLDNALSASFKNILGGSFHDDVVLGRAQAGSVFIEVKAFDESDGAGVELGRGCIGPIDVSADLNVESPILVTPDN